MIIGIELKEQLPPRGTAGQVRSARIVVVIDVVGRQLALEPHVSLNRIGVAEQLMPG